MKQVSSSLFRRHAAIPTLPVTPVGDRPGKRDRRFLERLGQVDEQTVFKVLERINRRVVEEGHGTARRAQHRKHHGCVRARFVVPADSADDKIPADLRIGLFAVPGEKEALIRFSNGLGTDDSKRDSHGMAVKVLGVPGLKSLKGLEQEEAQDFVLADHETFPTGDPRIMVRLNRILSGRGQARLENLLALLFTHPLVLLRSRKSTKKLGSLLDTSYFSAIPYRLGDHAVKYLVTPAGRRNGGGAVCDRDGLSLELAERLKLDDAVRAGGPVRFDFWLDVRTDADAQPIEDPGVAWSKAAGHRRVKVAEILIDRQDLSENAGLAENLAFSPWHALREHEPLGFVARARRHVYRALAQRRHELNEVKPYESSESPPSYADSRSRRFSSLYWDPPKLGRIRQLWKFTQQQLSGFANRFPWLIAAIQRIGPLQRYANRATINYFSSQTVQRPLPLSLWDSRADPVKPNAVGCTNAYVSWSGLTDRSFTGRHLPPMCEADVDALPKIAELKPLFTRVDIVPSRASSTLFCFFAQWLSDSFLRTHPDDTRRNTSNHELDLCQIYGLGAQEATRWLRADHGGLLKSRPDTVVGELPDLLVGSDLKVKGEFGRIAYDPIHATSFDMKDPPHGVAANLKELIRAKDPWAVEDDRWQVFYAGGLERANSTIFYSAFNTIFLREHNRLARALARHYRTDDNDWLFETARNINLVKYLKVLIEDYINHLTGSKATVRLAQGFADTCRWYRTNRITLEFNLLYRWHSLVPDTFRLGGREHWDHDFRYNNAIVETWGVERLIDEASRQRAGRVCMRNTPDFLVPAEVASLNYSRQYRLAGFNAYRRRWGLEPYRSFEEMTGTATARQRELAGLLRHRYGTEDSGGLERLELPVGLFAERHSGEAEQSRDESVLPILLSLMVASDAFSHALTNPLLAAYVYGEDAFTDFGMGEIARVSCLADIVRDNVAPGMPQPLTSFRWVDDEHRPESAFAPIAW